MDAKAQLKTYVHTAMEVFLLFFGFVLSQAVVTLFLALPYVIALCTQLAADGIGVHTAVLTVERSLTMEFLPRHSATVSLLSSVLAAVVLLPVMRKKYPPLSQSLGLKKAPLKSFFPVFPLGIGLQISISLLLLWVLSLPAMEGAAKQMSEYSALISGGNNRLLEILAVVIATPLCEELFFRGAILFCLKKAGLPVWLCVTLQAALFGLVHGLPVQIAYAFLIGVLFGFLTEKHHCLWHSILLHALFNAAGYWSEIFPGDAALWLKITLFVLATLICLAALVLIFYPHKNKGEPHAT